MIGIHDLRRKTVDAARSFLRGHGVGQVNADECYVDVLECPDLGNALSIPRNVDPLLTQSQELPPEGSVTEAL